MNMVNNNKIYQKMCMHKLDSLNLNNKNNNNFIIINTQV